MLWLRSGQDFKPVSTALKVHRAQWTSTHCELKTFGTTKTSDRAGRASDREVTKNPVVRGTWSLTRVKVHLSPRQQSKRRRENTWFQETEPRRTLPIPSEWKNEGNSHFETNPRRFKESLTTFCKYEISIFDINLQKKKSKNVFVIMGKINCQKYNL